MQGHRQVQRPRNSKKIHQLEDIHDFVTANGIHEIWITLPMSASDQLHQLQYSLRNTLVDIRWMPDIFQLANVEPQDDRLSGHACNRFKPP
ncbi:hypothetical protein ACFS07_02655 [Undibacterium arcticum]